MSSLTTPAARVDLTRFVFHIEASNGTVHWCEQTGGDVDMQFTYEQGFERRWPDGSYIKDVDGVSGFVLTFKLPRDGEGRPVTVPIYNFCFPGLEGGRGPLERAEQTVERLRALLERLAPEDCPQGALYGQCAFCLGHDPRVIGVGPHEPDCAWVATREELAR